MSEEARSVADYGDDELMPPDPAGQFLGFVDGVTLMAKKNEWKVPYVRVGDRHVRFRKRDLKAWLNSRVVNAAK